MKFGIVRFPGTCDDIDAQLAAGRVGEAVLLWHAERDLQGVDAVIVPGGFSYGDYLRTGAIARFAPVMEAVIEFARDGGLVLGICNGFQILYEAEAYCRGAAPERLAAVRAFARWTWKSPTPTRPSQAGVPRADSCRSRSSTRPAATTRRTRSTWCFATRPVRTRTDPRTTSREF